MSYNLNQSSQLMAIFAQHSRWSIILSGLILVTTFPTFAAYVPLTGVSQLWKGGVSFPSCVITSSGGVKCWGNNRYGGLGDYSTTDRLIPVDVSGLTSGVTAVATGEGHTCALTSSSGVKCWGQNGNSQLGNGSTIDRYIPVEVTGLTSGVTTIATGGFHTCALTRSGGVKCWGNNSFGQLGDNSTTDRSTPVDVTSLTSGVTAIATGDYHTCALTSSGGIKCWGHNGFGQLGDNTTTNHSTPVDVIDLTSGMMAIAAGVYYTCALTSSGGVNCWGRNVSFLHPSDNSILPRLTPVDVTGLTSGVTAIAMGTDHTCALTSSGGVKCWGYNDFGQLGDTTTTNSLIPVDVTGLTSGVMAIATGLFHTCALTNGGKVKCWGSNSSGELGDNTTINSSIPVEVLVSDTPPSPSPVLTVSKTGNGIITTNPVSDIDCGSTCTVSYPSSSSMTLIATPSVDSQFQQWSGDCTGTSPWVVVVMDAAKQCVATFGHRTTGDSGTGDSGSSVELTVMAGIRLCTNGPGQRPIQCPISGTVTSTPPGIDCSFDCTASYPLQTTVSLIAKPSPGYQFYEWSGDCTGTNPSVSVVMEAAKQCVATFEPTTTGDSGSGSQPTSNPVTTTVPTTTSPVSSPGMTGSTPATPPSVAGQCLENQKGVYLQNTCHSAKILLPGAFDNTGTPRSTTAEIVGGMSKEGGDYLSSITVKVVDSVVIAGSIKADPADMGKTVDIIVAGIYYTTMVPNGLGYTWYILNGKNNTCDTCVEVWNFDSRDVASSLALLTAFRTGETLTDYRPVQIYAGTLPFLGNLDVYLGYRITSGSDKGKMVFNSQPISATIQP